MELWGYVADVVLNDKICEKFMPNIGLDHKHQILQWLYSKWTNGLTEKNLSIVEKMTKDIVLYPQDYLDIWNWYKFIKYFVICVFKNLAKVLFIRKHSKF